MDHGCRRDMTHARLLDHEDNRTDIVHAAQLLDLPDSLLQQHLLPLLAGTEKKMLRLVAHELPVGKLWRSLCACCIMQTDLQHFKALHTSCIVIVVVVRNLDV